MIRKIFCVILLGILVGVVWSPVRAQAPPIQAQAAVLLDAKTGDVLFDKKMHTRGAPASTTKILTAIIAIESGRLNDEVKVSIKAAATPGSSMHLFAGQQLSLRELLTGLLLRSGNDAAVAIAEHLAGSVDAFVDIMNQKALLIGAMNSHFRNPHGLTSAGHFTTAFDLAWIARYAMNNPIFAEIVSTKETNIEWQDRSGHEHDRNLRNTNKLLWMLEDADGVKTGTTNEAGPCLVSSATRGNQKLIAVVLNDHSRWYDSMKLLKWGFEQFDLFEYASQNDVIAPVQVEKGLIPVIDGILSGPGALVVNGTDYSEVTVRVDLPEKIRAPVYRGQKIGEIIFYVRGNPEKTVDIVASRDVEEKTIARTFFRKLIALFGRLATWGVL